MLWRRSRLLSAVGQQQQPTTGRQAPGRRRSSAPRPQPRYKIHQHSNQSIGRVWAFVRSGVTASVPHAGVLRPTLRPASSDISTTNKSPQTASSGLRGYMADDGAPAPLSLSLQLSSLLRIRWLSHTMWST